MLAGLVPYLLLQNSPFSLRSRTGCIVVAYLLLSGKFTSGDQAISFFNETRSKEGQNVVLPSQVRWVNYFENVRGHSTVTPHD